MTPSLRTLFTLALPVALGNAAAAVNELVNRYVLGQVSEAALAASLPGSMLALVFTGVFANTVGYATALVAEAHGAKDEARERRTFVQGLWLAAATIPLFVLAVPAGIGALRLIGHEPDVLRGEIVYFAFSALGGLLSVFTTALGAWHAGRGRTGLPAAAALAGCVTDIAATPLLVLSAGLGIAGAGLAKTLGLVVTLLVLAVAVRRDLARRPAPANARSFDKPLFRRLVRLGLPFGLSSLVGSGTFTAFVMCLGACGAEALAVGNICFALNNLFNTMLTGVETAVVIVIGKCKGAVDAGGARHGFRAGLVLSLLALAVCYGPVLLASDGLLAFFLDEAATDAARSLARLFLAVLFVSGIFETLKHTATGALRGAGRTDSVLAAHLAVSAGLWTPAVIVLTMLTHDALVLWPSIAVYTILHALVLATRVPKALAFDRLTPR